MNIPWTADGRSRGDRVSAGQLVNCARWIWSSRSPLPADILPSTDAAAGRPTRTRDHLGAGARRRATEIDRVERPADDDADLARPPPAPPCQQRRAAAAPPGSADPTAPYAPLRGGSLVAHERHRAT
jgi:hypothetical protein